MFPAFISGKSKGKVKQNEIWIKFYKLALLDF